jgi:hypothetical protein
VELSFRPSHQYLERRQHYMHAVMPVWLHGEAFQQDALGGGGVPEQQQGTADVVVVDGQVRRALQPLLRVMERLVVAAEEGQRKRQVEERAGGVRVEGVGALVGGHGVGLMAPHGEEPRQREPAV